MLWYHNPGLSTVSPSTWAVSLQISLPRPVSWDHTSFTWPQWSVTLKWQHRSNKNMNPVAFFFFPPPPLQTMSFKLFFQSSLRWYSAAGWWKKVQPNPGPTLLQNTEVQRTPHCSLDHQDIFLSVSHYSATPVSIFLLWETHCPQGLTYTLWKIFPSFPHADSGKGNSGHGLTCRENTLLWF